MKTMLDDGLLKLDQTTVSEIIRVVPHEMIKEFRLRETRSTALSSGDETMEGALTGADFSENGNLVISDPKTDVSLIDKLYGTYEMLNHKTGGASIGIDASLFRDFIQSNYHKICDQFGCNRVNFFLKPNEDKVEILASPVR